MHEDLRLADRRVGPRHPCFVIAEAGVNHNGDLSRALELVDIAASAGADAVKFQTFSTERLVLADAPKAQYQLAGTDTNESQFGMLRALELSYDAHLTLKRRTESLGMIFLSTPFDEQSADMLEALGVIAFKTPSGELTNLPYLEHVARFKKPMIVSTGMATLGEVEAAVTAVEGAGCRELALLHCVSNYPAVPESINLRAMKTLSRAFRVPVGYSDHTLGIDVAIASVALGASVLEKHFTVDRTLPGPDHRASLQPDELTDLIRSIRNVERARGDGRKVPHPSERSTADVARKSLVASCAIAAGTTIVAEHLSAMRPGTGIPITLRHHVIGRTARTGIEPGTMLRWEMLA